MTVSELYNFPTSDLVSHFTFIPADINVPHYQLRNFISSAYKNKIYYVQNYDVFVFDLQKKQRCLVATVPFEARCLAAAHGWIGVGGEFRGDCAFIRIGEDESQVGNFGLDLLVDSMGQEIVNSMTIHKVPARHSNQQDEVVVLISNNDRTVTLYSLSQQEVLSVLTHPKPMNFASMSPDCTLITAVGDANEVYVYRRKDPEHGGEDTASAEGPAARNWQLIATPTIPAAPGVRDDWSFAVAFSPNGRLCAVSAQGGLITVFDVQTLIKNPKRAGESIICSFKSSRSSVCGCVRSMAFSPAPWDLLAWTEDHGKIGIADVRQYFTRRQCLSLEQKSSKTVEWEDTTPVEYNNLDLKERLKRQHSQRLRALRGHLPVGARSFEDMQRPQSRRDSSSHHPSNDLNDSERSVLNALQSSMSDVEHQVLGPYSVNYSPTHNIHSPATASVQSAEYEVQLLNPVGARTRGAPQRRQSIVLSDTSSNRYLVPLEDFRSVMTASPLPMPDDTSIPPMSTNDLTPAAGGSSSQPRPHNIPTLPYTIPPSDPWHVIEATLVTERARDVGSTTSFDPVATLAQVESAIRAERQLADRLERQLLDERRLATLLRSEIDARTRVVEAQQQELQAQRSAELRLSPSSEHMRQRQLQNEQDNGRQRSNELEGEIRTNSQRMERLITQRQQLLNHPRLLHPGDSPPSARSTALPTTHTSTSDTPSLPAIVRRLEADRLARQQHILDLEAQVRRAESRVESTSVQSSSERAESVNRYHERLLDARFLSAARAGSSAGTLRQLRNAANDNTSATSTQASTNRLRGAAARRAEAAMNADRSSIPVTSELHNRITDNDVRMARIMMQRAETDANGNWISGQGLRNILGARRAIGVGIGSTRARPSAIEAMNTEEGVGTAGIGWDPDGRYL